MAVTLVLEDGTGTDPDANAYTDRTAADTYHGNKLRSDWTGYSNDQKDAAIIRATEYIDTIYAKSFKGSPLEDDQALEWPREYAYDRYGRALEEVPAKLAKATAELALYAARQGELLPRPLGPTETLAGVQSGAPSVGSVKMKKEKVGPLEEVTEYTVGSFRQAFPAVHALLQDLLSTSDGVIR
jgi:hypothetical protein